MENNCQLFPFRMIVIGIKNRKCLPSRKDEALMILAVQSWNTKQCSLEC